MCVHLSRKSRVHREDREVRGLNGPDKRRLPTLDLDSKQLCPPEKCHGSAIHETPARACGTQDNLSTAATLALKSIDARARAPQLDRVPRVRLSDARNLSLPLT